MRKEYLFLIVILPLLLSRSAGAQPAVGIWGGLNRAHLSGDAPEDAGYQNRLGLAAGVVGEFNLTRDVKLSLQPMYVQRGTRIAYDLQDYDEPHDSLDVKLNYFSLPVMIKVISGNGKTYVSSGLDFGVLMQAELADLNREGAARDIKNLLQDFDVAVNFGFGVMLPVGSPLLTFELRYSQSLLNLSKTGENTESAALPERFRSTGLQLLAGLLIPIGGKS